MAKLDFKDLDIRIRVVPPAEVGYEGSPADYKWGFNLQADKELLTFTIGDTGNYKYNALVFFHEMIEALTCEMENIREEDVAAFDKHHEERRKAGEQVTDEAGFDRLAPYHQQHYLATICEMAIAKHLHVDWEAYGERIDEVVEEQETGQPSDVEAVIQWPEDHDETNICPSSSKGCSCDCIYCQDGWCGC